MANQFRLLLQAISIERAALDEPITIATERVAHQRQIEASASLGLPDMGHFVNEQALERQALLGEILRPVRALGVSQPLSQKEG